MRVKGVDDVISIHSGVIASDFSIGGGPEVTKLIFGPPEGFDLDANPYYTDINGLRVLLLSPEQYATVPDGTVLFDTQGGRFIKGKGDHPMSPMEGGYLNVGFPDKKQKGFEKFGADGGLNF
jgi:hypothetical protein